MNSRMTCFAFGAKCGPTVCDRGRERVVGEQIGEAEHADAAAHALQRFAPREFVYGQKITSLVESSACAYRATSRGCARYFTPSAISSAVAFLENTFR